MRPDSGIDQTSLAWLKPEIDASLARAGQALERHAEENFTGDGASEALAALHEVLGGLRMLELYGAALVAEEMEALVVALSKGSVQRVEDALTSLLRATLQLPDYLERLQSGYRDVPIVLLPLLNDLRSCRGEKLLSESVLLVPPSDPEPPAHLPSPHERLAAAELERRLMAVRRDWQFALLQWFRGQDNEAALARLADASTRILGLVSVRPARQLWWVASAVTGAMREHALDASISAKLLYGRLDREIKRLVDQGEVLYQQVPPTDLLRSLLYYAAQSAGGATGEVQAAFQLGDLVRSDAEVDEARGALTGRNSSLLNSVVQALEEELLKVKDALDLYIRGDRGDTSLLKAELEVLDRVADTLGMVGMGRERADVQAQRNALAGMVAGGHGDDQALLEIAGALIGVESSLQSHREHLGVAGEDAGSGERRRLAAAVVREAAVNLQQAKELFVAHLAGAAGNEHNLTSAMLLRDVAGALRVLEFEAASERALSLAGFLRARDAAAMPLSAEEINGFADALAGLEFYLELVADHQGHGEGGLERVTEALLRLGHWPPKLSLRDLFGATAGVAPGTASSAAADASAPADAGSAAATSEPPMPERINDEAVEPERPIEATASAGLDIAGREPFQALIDESGFGFDADSAAGADPEIRDTFLEELTEEIGNLDASLPGYVRNPDDLELLRTIRRSYHTIKGSGRMVGARVLGEFAWQIENLLNRVLAGKRPASPSVMRVLENASATLPEFHAALCGDLQPRRDIAGIMAVAAALAEGEELMLPVDAMAPARADRPRQTAPEAAAPPAFAASSDIGDAKPVQQTGDDGSGQETVVEDAGFAWTESGDATPAWEPATGDAGEVLDPVLLDILRSEVAGHIGVIDAYLHDSRENPALAAVPEHLLRAVHTLNGAFGAVELPAVTQLTAALEGYVRRLRALRRAPSDEGYAVVTDASGALSQVLDRLDAGRELPDLVPLSNRLVSLTEEQQEVREDTAWLVGEPVPPVEQLLAEAAREDAETRAAEARAADLAATIAPVPDSELPEPAGQATEDLPAIDAGLAEDELERMFAAADSGEDLEIDFEADDLASGGADDADATALLDSFLEPTPVVSGTVAERDEQQPAGEEQRGPSDQAEPPPSYPSEQAAEPQQAVPDAEFRPAMPPEPLPLAADDGWQAVEGDERTLLRSLLDGQKPLPPGDIDPDLAELFREEAREILDRCEQHLARGAEIGQAELSQELARELHTLKGGARMAGFVEAGELGHAMESLLEAANNEQRDLDAEDLTLIGRCLDRLNGLVFGVAAAAESAPAAPAPAPAAEPREPPSLSQAGGDGARRMPEHVDLHALTAGAVPAAEGVVTEFVRVRADQLDSLVNLAGEVGIIRTRLEQQIGSFRFSLEEFEQTVMRLREQLRKLEIEAETQILSREVRVQEQSGGASGFDPLEMDRFSQLQQLSRALAESMSDLQSIQGLLDEHTRLAESLLLQQSRAGAELQEGLMRARMVPFESMLPRLRRLVRQEAEALGKKVRLTVEGAQGELDRGVLERMAAPFEHMLRNALVHGLEAPTDRRSVGKGEEGELRIRVAREATEVVIEVADDGRGIDAQRVRRTAIDRGLLSAESDLSDRDLYGFILEPGFSTASELTQYAGRGVGMDVVASEIKQLGGSLAIDSTMGQGASFRVRLPYTLAVSQAVLVRVSDHTFAVPMVGVQGIVRLAYANYKERIRETRPKVEYAGEDYEIYELDAVLGMHPSLLDDNAQVPLLMVRAGDLKVALRVDSLLGGREIVVKPVGPQLARIPGVFGATILGDGAVVVILDVSALLRRAAALRDRGDALAPVAPVVPAARQRPLVLVVDDSITMRKVSARVLEREGYEVQTAKDGLDALEHVHERLPDVILLDLEMPRMDGYEFAGYMRNDPRFRAVPIIVITSRVGEKHRARAFEIGVNRYLGKPYQEADMLKAVAELLAEQQSVN